MADKQFNTPNHVKEGRYLSPVQISCIAVYTRRRSPDKASDIIDPGYMSIQIRNFRICLLVYPWPLMQTAPVERRAVLWRPSRPGAARRTAAGCRSLAPRCAGPVRSGSPGFEEPCRPARSETGTGAGTAATPATPAFTAAREWRPTRMAGRRDTERPGFMSETCIGQGCGIRPVDMSRAKGLPVIVLIPKSRNFPQSVKHQQIQN